MFAEIVQIPNKTHEHETMFEQEIFIHEQFRLFLGNFVLLFPFLFCLVLTKHIYKGVDVTHV